ncbi:MAG: imidazole glycerol phosphate synthase subunit HisH [Rhodospirillales bacterium]
MTETVAIIDYGSGNLRSAAKAFERAAREAALSAHILVTADAERVAAADRIVLPGVGAFGDCRAGLAALPGMIEALNEAVLAKARPFLGICVGMQLLATRGREHGLHPGLNWIAGEVVPVAPENNGHLKVPHMGWNELVVDTAHPVFAGLESGHHAYFVHSFHMVPDDRDALLAHVDYGGLITAAVGRDTIVGTQFHPEKSQAAGLRLITNFLTWKP